MYNSHTLAKVHTTLGNVCTLSLITILVHSTSACSTKAWYQRLTSLYLYYIYTCFQWLTNLYGSLHHALLKCAQKTRWITNLYVQLQMGFGLGTLDCHLPYLCIVLSALDTHIHTKLQKISKRMRILYLHSILTIPSCILRTIPFPLDFYQLHGSISELLDFLV
jgi:hypothetical protein